MCELLIFFVCSLSICWYHADYCLQLKHNVIHWWLMLKFTVNIICTVGWKSQGINHRKLVRTRSASPSWCFPPWSTTRCTKLTGLAESVGKEDPATQPPCLLRLPVGSTENLALRGLIKYYLNKIPHYQEVWYWECWNCVFTNCSSVSENWIEWLFNCCVVVESRPNSQTLLSASVSVSSSLRMAKRLQHLYPVMAVWTSLRSVALFLFFLHA